MAQRRQDLKQASKWGRGWEALPVRESQGAELEGSISGRELTWRHSQRRLAAASSSTLPAQSAVDNNNNGKLQPPIKIQVVDSGANWMRTSQLVRNPPLDRESTDFGLTDFRFRLSDV